MIIDVERWHHRAGMARTIIRGLWVPQPHDIYMSSAWLHKHNSNNNRRRVKLPNTWYRQTCQRLRDLLRFTTTITIAIITL